VNFGPNSTPNPTLNIAKHFEIRDQKQRENPTQANQDTALEVGNRERFATHIGMLGEVFPLGG
jgi:hypothetical protein